MVWQHTLKLLTQSIITPTPQLNQELLCWQNYEEEERGKSGQDKDRGGDFCPSEGRRDWWEDQRRKSTRMRKELVGWMQDSMVFLCLTIEAYINCFATFLQIHFMLLSSYLAATRAYCRFFWVPYCLRSATNIMSNNILQILVDKKWGWWLSSSNRCC